MQSTTSASTIARRISPSPLCCELIEPLASTTPAVPNGARWWTMCCSQAKLALPAGGVPYVQRGSSRRRSPPQSLMLNGGLARMKLAFRSRSSSLWKLPSLFQRMSESMPRTAKFILHSRQVV